MRARRFLRMPSRRKRPADAPALPTAMPQFTGLPGWPFAVAVSTQGDCAFVSMPRAERKGVVVLSPEAPWRVQHVAWVAASAVPRGMALDRCARHLLVANEEWGLLVMDVGRLRSGSA